MSFSNVQQSDIIGYNLNPSIDLNTTEQATYMSSNLYSDEGKIPHTLASEVNMPFARRYEDCSMITNRFGEFCNSMSDSQMGTVDATENSSRSSSPFGKSKQRNNSIISFQYLCDGVPGERTSSEESIAAKRTNGVSQLSDNLQLSKQNAIMKTRSVNVNQNLESIPAISESDETRVIENYILSMPDINGVEGQSIECDTKTPSVDDEEFICNGVFNCSGSEQIPFIKRMYRGIEYNEQSHIPSETVRNAQSRESDENDEVKGKKNGEESHSRTAEAGRVVGQPEIQHPEANFQQRDFVHKLERSEHAAKSNVDQSSSMLIAADDQNVGCTRDTFLAHEAQIESCSSDVFTPKSSPLPSLVGNYMSPDHPANITHRSGSRKPLEREMQSLQEDKDPVTTENSSCQNEVMNEHPVEISDDKSKNGRMPNVFTNDTLTFGKHGDIRRGSQEPDITKSGGLDTIIDARQNGDLIDSDERDDENTTLGKHIYPWMKETRQNTRRKQSTSSNSSSNGDKSSKRERTAYTNAQLVELEKEFHFNRYLCRPRRIEMAQMLSLTERQIKIWFQNRRMKYKKDQKMKTVPVGREGAYYHPHHHPSNMVSDSVFSRNNDHRHYHGGHFHPSAENTGPSSCGVGCSSTSRCYHSHRHHGSNADGRLAHTQPLSHGATSSFDGNNKSYQSNIHKNNAPNRLTSPSSASSNGTLSPGNGRSSAFGSEVGIRSSSSSGSEPQNLTQPGCGYLPHAMSPHQNANSLLEDENSVLREKNASSAESRRLISQPGYDVPFHNNGFTAFQRRVDDITSRMPFGNGGLSNQISMPNHYLSGYDRSKDSSIPLVQGAVGNNRRYDHFHNPLESLSDCVQRSPREFQNQSQFSNHMNTMRHPSTDVFPGAFIPGHCSSNERNRFDRSNVEQSPLDFSRSKSSSPRIQQNDAFINNRLTHL